MQLRFANLLEALQRAVMAPPKGLRGALDGLPAADELPSPWETWLLICLLRYRQRQRWAVQVLERHFPEALPLSRDLLDRWKLNRPLPLCVPGMPDWELTLECAGHFGTLAHKVTGERVTIGLSTSDTDHPLFVDSLDRYVRSKPPESPEGRLSALHPVFLTVWFAAEELEAADLLEGTDFEDHPYGENLEPDAHRLTQMATRFEEPVIGFVKHWEQPGSRLWLAARIGDWLLARELATASGREDLLAVIAPRAEGCRQRRLETARRDRDQDPDLRELLVLDEMGGPELEARIRRGLLVMPNAAWVLDFVDPRDDPKWCPEILRLFRRVRPGGPMEWPDLAVQCAGFLARHNYPAPGVIESVARSQEAMDEAAMFLLEHAPESALPVVRRALRDTAPPAGQPDLFGKGAAQLSSQSARLAVILAVIDRPWSRRESFSALDELQDRGAGLTETAAVALALAESCDPEARQVAATWRSRYDPDEYDRLQGNFENKMKRMRNRVARIRHCVPVGGGSSRRQDDQ